MEPLASERDRLRVEVVAALLSARSGPPVRPEDVADDVLVGEGGLGLTSLTVLQALVAVEDALGVVLDDRAVAQAQLSSVGTVVDLVAREHVGVDG